MVRIKPFSVDQVSSYLFLWGLIALLFGIGSVINLHALNTAFDAISDFNPSDYVTRHNYRNKPSGVISSIVLYDIGQEDRKSLAQSLTKLHSYQPLAIGLNLYLQNRNGDPAADSALAAALLHTKDKIVMGHIGQAHHGEQHGSHPANHASPDNLLTKALAQLSTGYLELGKHRTIRDFVAFDSTPGHAGVNEAFALKLLEKGNPQAEIIADIKKNYNRQTIPIKFLIGENNIIVLNKTDLEDSLRLQAALAGNYLIMGYVGEGHPRGSRSLEDLHFTAVNGELFGRSHPDMYGSVIQANILMMLDQGKLVYKNRWLDAILCVLLTYVVLYRAWRVFFKSHEWFHLWMKVALLSTVVLLAVVTNVALSLFNVLLDVRLASVAILVMADAMYLYEAAVQALPRKFLKQSVVAKVHHV